MRARKQKMKGNLFLVLVLTIGLAIGVAAITLGEDSHAVPAHHETATEYWTR